MQPLKIQYSCPGTIVLLMCVSIAKGDPTIPVENHYGGYLKLTVKAPGKTWAIELNKEDKKSLDLNIAGSYELVVTDADNKTARIGMVDLRKELEKNPKVVIYLSKKFFRLAKGSGYNPAITIGDPKRLAVELLGQ